MIEEKDIRSFLLRAGELHNAFQATSLCPWGLQDIVSELCIQTGHLIQSTERSSLMEEKGRNLSHFGDEAADIFLQILVLSHLFPIDWHKVRLMTNGMDAARGDQILKSIIQGVFQLLESSLRINGKRFPQARHKEYGGEECFFSKTLSDIAACLLALVAKNKAELAIEFSAMEKEALKFLDEYARYRQETGGLSTDMLNINHKIQGKLGQLHRKSKSDK